MSLDSSLVLLSDTHAKKNTRGEPRESRISCNCWTHFVTNPAEVRNQIYFVLYLLSFCNTGSIFEASISPCPPLNISRSKHPNLLSNHFYCQVTRASPAAPSDPQFQAIKFLHFIARSPIFNHPRSAVDKRNIP